MKFALKAVGIAAVALATSSFSWSTTSLDSAAVLARAEDAAEEATGEGEVVGKDAIDEIVQSVYDQLGGENMKLMQNAFEQILEGQFGVAEGEEKKEEDEEAAAPSRRLAEEQPDGAGKPKGDEAAKEGEGEGGADGEKKEEKDGDKDKKDGDKDAKDGEKAEEKGMAGKLTGALTSKTGLGLIALAALLAITMGVATQTQYLAGVPFLKDFAPASSAPAIDEMKEEDQDTQKL